MPDAQGELAVPGERHGIRLRPAGNDEPNIGAAALQLIALIAEQAALRAALHFQSITSGMRRRAARIAARPAVCAAVLKAPVLQERIPVRRAALFELHTVEIGGAGNIVVAGGKFERFL